MYIHIYVYIYSIPSCSVVFRHVPSCSVMFRHVPSCSVMFRRVPSCSVVFRRVPVKNEQNRWTSVNNRIVETGTHRITVNPPSSSKLERVRCLSNLLPYHHSPTSSPPEASSHHSSTSSPPEASRLDASNDRFFLILEASKMQFLYRGWDLRLIRCHRPPQAATGCLTFWASNHSVST